MLMTDATGAATRVGLSSYHRMKQRAEIAEAEEKRLGNLVAEKTAERDITLDELRNLSNRFEDQTKKLTRERDHWLDYAKTLSFRDANRPTWRHDFGSVVGGVMLAAGLIAAIVWGVWF
jgi:hypothetical protein